MGKKLIIKGADFSANGIDSTMLNITNIFTLVDSFNGNTMASANGRKGVSPRIDLSSYKSAGYTKIKVVAKKNGCVCILTPTMGSIQNRQDTIYILGDSGVWGTAGTYIEDLDDTAKYFGGNINKDEAGDYSNLSDYMDVYVLKE